MAQIARMDMDQVLNVFLRPGDPDIAERGGYWPCPSTGQSVRANRYEDLGCGFETMFVELLRWRGCPEPEIQLRWREYLEANPHLAAQYGYLPPDDDTEGTAGAPVPNPKPPPTIPGLKEAWQNAR